MRNRLLDRMATRRAQAARMDVEERRAEREATARRGAGSADAGRGHLHHTTPAFEPDGPNQYTPRG